MPMHFTSFTKPIFINLDFISLACPLRPSLVLASLAIHRIKDPLCYLHIWRIYHLLCSIIRPR